MSKATPKKAPPPAAPPTPPPTALNSPPVAPTPIVTPSARMNSPQAMMAVGVPSGARTTRPLPGAKPAVTVKPKTARQLAMEQLAQREKEAEDDCLPIDPLMGAAIDSIRSQFGADHCMNLDELIQTAAGLPLPSLALCYLLGGDVWPLSRFFELYGSEGSCKSAFLYEVIRWFCLYRGAGTIVETENKPTGPLFKSIVGKFGESARKQITIEPAFTLQESQRHITHLSQAAVKLAEARAGKNKVPQFVMPFAWGIDSLMASGSEANLKRMHEDGAAKKNFPEEALLIKTFLQGLPDLIKRKPWSLVALNHYKPKKTDTGAVEENVPGGFAPKFYAGTRIRFDKVSEKTTVHYSAVKIRLYCTKTTQGQKKRSINVEMKWRTFADPVTGNTSQYTYWDWNRATIEMLLSTQGENKALWDAVNSVVDLHKLTATTIWSKVLGIKKDDPVSFSEAGRRLESNQELLRKLYPILGITHYPWYRAGVNFGDYIDKKTCWESDAQVKRWFDNDPHADFEGISEAVANAPSIAIPADSAYDEE